ncbi:MAG TPA: protease modulator HflK [Verrucomicrobiae bacterium]
MTTDRNVQRIGLINLVVFLGIGIAAAVTAQYVRSATAEVMAVLVGFGFLASLVSYLQMRLETQEQLEKLEFDELQKSKNAAALFDTAEAENFPAHRARLQFERFGVPTFAIILLLLQGAAIYFLWTRYDEFAGLNLSRAPVGMTFFGIFMLIQFMLGKYAAGVARLEKQRLLRPGSSYMLLCSFASLLALTALIFAYLGSPNIDVIIARILVVIIGFAAMETLFNVVFEAYRPRLKGQVTHLLYDSRVIGLVGDPAGFFATAAQALDYQFGFKVSETWFYRFLQRTIAWIILAQIGILWLSTVVVFIEPGEQAVLERFGKQSDRGVLEPGPHFKYPWPVDKVYRYKTRAIQSFLVGAVPDENLDKERTVLWTKAHYKEEFNMLVASRQQLTVTNNTDSTAEAAVPVNLLTASIPVQYTIKDLQKWAYNHEDAGKLLEKLATREVVNFLVSVDMDDIMARGRLDAANELQIRIQKLADKHELGVQIIFVGLQDIHPPTAVAEAYQEVNAALQAREGIIFTAEGERAQIIPMTRAEAANIIAEAQVYKLSEQAKGVAAAGRFPNQIVAYQASPEVFRQRSYLDSLGKAIAPARKYVIGVTNTKDTIIMNLEDKVRMDIIEDVALPTIQKQ